MASVGMNGKRPQPGGYESLGRNAGNRLVQGVPAKTHLDDKAIICDYHHLFNWPFKRERTKNNECSFEKHF